MNKLTEMETARGVHFMITSDRMDTAGETIHHKTDTNLCNPSADPAMKCKPFTYSRPQHEVWWSVPFLLTLPSQKRTLQIPWYPL